MTQVHPVQLEEIRRAVAEARAIDADDEAFIADHLEGATDIDEIVGGLLREREEYAANAEACRATAAEFAAKAKVWDDRAERNKVILGRIRNIVGQTIRHAFGTVIVSTLKSTPQKAPDFNPENLPDDLMRVEVIKRADAAKIKEAMEAGRNVPGYQWSEPRESISIRRK